MTIIYCDPEGGNDANAGTSFALRKKSIGSATTALVTAGDEVRIMASRDPVSIGNAQWTDGTASVVLDTAVNATIDDCEDGWLAGGAAGVTLTHSATNRKSGNYNLNIATGASAVATGILAVKSFVEAALSGFNPLAKSANVTLSNSNKTGAVSVSGLAMVAGAYPFRTAKAYFEVTIDSAASISSSAAIGVGPMNALATNLQVGFSNAFNSIGYQLGTPKIFSCPSVGAAVAVVPTMPAVVAGTVIGIAVDPATRQVWFRNGAGLWNNSATADPATGVGGLTVSGTEPLYPLVSFAVVSQYSINYGETAFANAAPTGFATAPASYPGIDLSAFTAISLWLTSNTTAAQNSGAEMFLDLCSDSAGQTPIQSIAFGIGSMSFSTAVCPSAVVVDTGAALPSAVKSIAIRTPTKIFSGTPAYNFYIDNIVACKGIGSANHLSHGCMIGKRTSGEPEWHPVMSIQGAQIGLGALADFTMTVSGRSYYGVTEKVTTYANFGTYLTGWFSSAAGSTIPAKTGTFAAPFKVTGGWNRADMSTQTGTTWLNGRNSFQFGFNWSSGGSFWNLDDGTLGFYGFYGIGITSAQALGPMRVKLAGVYNCGTPVSIGSGQSVKRQIRDYGNIGWNSSYATFSELQSNQCLLRVRRIFNGLVGGMSGVTYLHRSQARIQIGMIDGNLGYGINSTGSPCDFVLEGTVFKNNATGSINYTGVGRVALNNCTSTDPVLTSQPAAGPEIYVNGLNGNRWDNRYYSYAVNTLADQTVTHGTAAQSIKMICNQFDAADADTPLRTSLSRIAAFAGKTVTYKAWVKKDVGTNINAGVGCFANGVNTVDTVTYSTATDSSWQQVTVAVTPVVDGVIEFFGIAYPVGLTANPNPLPTCWFGDPTVSST